MLLATEHQFPFIFSEEWHQTAFLQFGYHFRGKYARCPERCGSPVETSKCEVFSSTDRAGRRDVSALPVPMGTVCLPYVTLSCPKSKVSRSWLRILMYLPPICHAFSFIIPYKCDEVLNSIRLFFISSQIFYATSLQNDFSCF